MQINHTTSNAIKAKIEIKNNALLDSFDTMTPNQVDDWVNENIKSVADIKEFLTLLVMAIQALELNK